MSDGKFTCGRRLNIAQDADHWREDGTCSYCGSISGEKALELIKNGATVTPTDKNYKMYINDGNGSDIKFYFHHFTPTQCQEFCDLMRDHKMKIMYPGYFYTLPFFIRYVGHEPN
ncbi:hypothetical protein [Ralstonia phage RP13]|nr:hypothetical protein [Ralstonia phage RP13]